MSEQAHDDDAREAETLMAAAMRAWETIARFAWQNGRTHGRGVVLVDRGDLLAVTDTKAPAVELPMTFVPVTHIPEGDDFRPVIEQHDPEQQVALMVGGSGDEHLIVLEPSDADRKRPSEC